MLIAIKTWALAHLLVNGNLEDILLFGSFLAWAVISFISSKRKDRANPITHEPKSYIIYDFVAIFAGLGIYVGFVLQVHEWITGVPIIT